MKTYLDLKGVVQIAHQAHQGQFRRDGKTPYITHPADVARRVRGDDRAEMVAWLHDVMEDSHHTPDTLAQLGVDEDVVDAVDLLTRKGHVPYEDYLVGVRGNRLARMVKIADMQSNLGGDPTLRQTLKYSRGLLFLHGELPGEGRPCGECERWRDKWRATRKYLRDANRGAESSSVALQLSSLRFVRLLETTSRLKAAAREPDQPGGGVVIRRSQYDAARQLVEAHKHRRYVLGCECGLGPELRKLIKAFTPEEG